MTKLYRQKQAIEREDTKNQKINPKKCIFQPLQCMYPGLNYTWRVTIRGNNGKFQHPAFSGVMNYAHPNMQVANRGYGEAMFIKMMAEEVEKGYSPGSIFNKKHQLYVYKKFRAIFGPIYSDRFLRSRFKQLKKRYHDFSEVLNHESIFWNRKTNIVEGNVELLKQRCKRNRMFNGQYHGEENYDLLCNIFESGVKFE